MNKEKKYLLQCSIPVNIGTTENPNYIYRTWLRYTGYKKGKQVLDAIEYSDPVTHKKVSSLEKEIIKKLQVGLNYSKNKHFDKTKSIMKDSNGVLFLIKERNR